MSSKARKLRRTNMSEDERKQRAFIRFLKSNGMDASEEESDLLYKKINKELLKIQAREAK